MNSDELDRLQVAVRLSDAATRLATASAEVASAKLQESMQRTAGLMLDKTDKLLEEPA